MKRLVVLAAVAMLALPAASLGATPSKAASASCKAQLKASGAADFAKVYTSFGACVSKATRQTPAQRQNTLSAEKQCRSQQLADAAAFQAKYGTNNKTNGKHANAPTSGTASNAFGKCVSALASA